MPARRISRIVLASCFVSLAIPAIHPWLAICAKGEALCHQRAFADCAKSEQGFQTMLVAAKALARTALDLFDDPELVKAAHAEYRAARG